MLRVWTRAALALFSLIIIIGSSAQGHNITAKCSQDTNAFLMELEKNTPEKYAVQMYDAFGKLGSDVEGGNVNRVGSLQECLSVEGPDFNGQYCQVFLKQGALEYFVGICVPDSCNDWDVRMLVVYETFDHGNVSLVPPVPSMLIPDTTLGIFMTQCISNNFTLDLSAAICLCVCILMVALPLTASIYVGISKWKKFREVRPGLSSILTSNPNHYGTVLANGSPNQSREHFSLQEAMPADGNTERKQESHWLRCLQTISVQSSSVRISDCAGVRECYPSLNGIRILSLLWIICGHTVQLSAWVSLDNDKRWRQAVENNPLYVFAFSGPVYLAVDSFLLLGGLLSAKSLLSSIQRAEDKLTWRLIAHFLIKRFKRIQPLHLFIVCTIITLFPLLQRGVFWFISEDEIVNCKNYWWSNLLLINNLFTITDICAPWTWYLSIDFQFYATTPLLIALYRLNRTALVAVTIVLLVLSSTAGAVITAYFHLPVHQPTTLAYESYFQYYYNKPYTRYGPYLLGILVGLHLATKKDGLIKQRWQAVAGWVSSLSIMALLVGLAYVLREVPPLASPAHAVYQGLHRLLWAIAVAWVILACEEGYGGFVNQILSMNLWTPLSNISFACYLIHPVLILVYNSQQETPIHYTDFNFFYLFLGHMLLTIIMGYVLTVLIEKPYLLLNKTQE